MEALVPTELCALRGILSNWASQTVPSSIGPTHKAFGSAACLAIRIAVGQSSGKGGVITARVAWVSSMIAFLMRRLTETGGANSLVAAAVTRLTERLSSCNTETAP